MHKFLPAVAVLLWSGCGYEGQPLPPLANIPSPVTGLSANQLGSRLVIRFGAPTLTTEGMPIQSVLTLDVRVGPTGERFDENAWAATARRLASGSTKDGAFQYETDTAAWMGKNVTVGVRAIGPNGKPSNWSFASVPVVAPPQPPSNLKAENTASGVRLVWNGSGSVFRIYRKTGAGEFVQVAEAPLSPWTDNTSQFGQRYEYKIQTVVKSDNHEAESPFSPAVTIATMDIFPPATPSGLEITAAPNSFELSWNGDTEPDLAVYRVYRSVDGGPFRKVGDVELPAFSDKDVQMGKSYRYEVSAVDRMGNESPRSQPVEARWQ
ncbi:MAG TPA: hypothetical protein VKV17_02955 [Bryobacteraceae bacterium]|nr:hypothetical protein [Bryobacteraceae bacterium]